MPLLLLLAADILQHHRNPTRDGAYTDPAFTRSAAAALHRDLSFHAPLPGPVYAQPLYIRNGPGGRAAFLVVTEQNIVLALHAADGSRIWTRFLGNPVPLSQLPCGVIDPLGITGTPAIDPDRRAIYVDAMTTPDDGFTKLHRIFALSIDDGGTLPGWPFDLSNISGFDSEYQNQRGALLLNSGYIYVPYGGHAGDCGNYHGWVVAVRLDDPTQASAWATGANAGGIWAPGGLATDGTSVYAITGNTAGADQWVGGEAVVRLGPGATFSGDPADYFAPTNWLDLDAYDLDLGGSGPVLVEVPGASPSQLIIALGKNGVVYLLDRNNLGGIGDGVSSETVTTGSIVNAAAAYTTASGTYIVMKSTENGIGCPGKPGDLIAVRIAPTTPPTINVAWCADNLGGGSPIVTTTDGQSEPLVWTAGAEYTNQMHAYNAETGELVYTGGGTDEHMGNIRHFQVPIVVDGRLFVAADDELYAFELGPQAMTAGNALRNDESKLGTRP
jgi:hypothetical protein